MYLNIDVNYINLFHKIKSSNVSRLRLREASDSLNDFASGTLHTDFQQTIIYKSEFFQFFNYSSMNVIFFKGYSKRVGFNTFVSLHKISILLFTLLFPFTSWRVFIETLICRLQYLTKSCTLIAIYSLLTYTWNKFS